MGKEGFFGFHWKGFKEAGKKQYFSGIVTFILIFIVVPLLSYIFKLKLPTDPNLKWPQPEYIKQLFTLNWKAIFGILTVTGVCLAIWKFVPYVLARYRKLKTEATIKKDLGLINFYPVSHYSSDGTAEANKEIQTRAEQQVRTLFKDSSHVDIILVSGYRALGTIETPGFLADGFKKDKASYRIFLLNPTSTNGRIERRAERIHKSIDEYREGIKEVLKHLALMKFERKLPIRVWLYDENPTLQMYKTDGEIWIQSAVSSRTEQAPLLGFSKEMSPFSLYWPLERLWERMHDMWGQSEADLRIYFPTIATPDPC